MFRFLLILKLMQSIIMEAERFLINLFLLMMLILHLIRLLF